MHKKGAIVLATVFLSGAFFGYLARAIPSIRADSLGARAVREIGDFTYTNPLLECEIAEGAINAPKINFKNALAGLVEDIKDRGDASAIAVYYRDLNNGPAFGVNENAKFIPASLLKVPVMMAYYDWAETDPSVLARPLRLAAAYRAPDDGVQLIAPEREIEAGKEYAVEALIERAIIHSDNQAVTLLIEHLPPKYLRDIYRILGVDDGVLNGPDGRLSVREYASFFRILFNSSYLSRKRSEQALAMLARTKFDRGIVAGVASGTPVAHKFGEGGYDNDHQIHDCGIVYYPGHPYLLCIMTRGRDIPTLTAAIRQISAFVYGKIDEAYAGNGGSPDYARDP